MSNFLELYLTFPPGTWRVEIKGIRSPMDFEGEHIFPTEHGCFFKHPPAYEGAEWRTSYFPWYKVDRAYTIREENESGKEAGAGSDNGVPAEERERESDGD